VPDLYEILESYGARDIISVEDPADTDLEGINAATLWTRSLAEVFGQEHALAGKHATLKVPRAVIRVSSGNAIQVGSVFDGQRATDAGVTAISLGIGLVTVSGLPTLGVYAAAAYCHDAGNLTPTMATTNKLDPNACDVLFSNGILPHDFTLLLWWD